MPVQPEASPPTSLLRSAADESTPCSLPKGRPFPSPFRPRAPAAAAVLARAQGAYTVFIALDQAARETASTQPLLIGRKGLSASGEVLAYQVVEGLDPLDNDLTVVDFERGAAWRIDPLGDCAVLGFALDPPGQRLALLQVSMRGQLLPAGWQIGVIHLPSNRAYALQPERPAAVALAPVAWSGSTDEILLRGFVPFQAYGSAGLWAASADGSHLRQLMPEEGFVGEPALSPDGRQLAVLASDPTRLPGGYHARAGEPPANALRLLDLATERQRDLLVDDLHAYQAIAWETTGESLYVSRGTWSEPQGAYHYEEILRLMLSQAGPQSVVRTPKAVLGLRSCQGGGVMALIEQGSSTLIRWDGQRQTQSAPFEFEPAGLEVVACD